MQSVTSVELKRDCPAIAIPAGTTTTLSAGTPVNITQSLGGSFTVHAPGGLFRIAAADADALGEALHKAVYNFMYGVGLDEPVGFWFPSPMPPPRLSHDAVRTWIGRGTSAFDQNDGVVREVNPVNAVPKSQIGAQGKAFEETGGFSERLMAKRIETREQQKTEGSPECPQCGKPMRRRKSAKGEFWGCAGYPDCKGTRPT